MGVSKAGPYPAPIAHKEPAKITGTVKVKGVAKDVIKIQSSDSSHNREKPWGPGHSRHGGRTARESERTILLYIVVQLVTNGITP